MLVISSNLLVEKVFDQTKDCGSAVILKKDEKIRGINNNQEEKAGLAEFIKVSFLKRHARPGFRLSRNDTKNTRPEPRVVTPAKAGVQAQSMDR